jgi:D-alanine-D-alanine ligase
VSAGLKKIAVLLGGTSSEREVSLASGHAAIESLLRLGFEVVAIDPIQPSFIEKLLHGNFDLAFIALHGKVGEDGCIQGLLTCMNIPYTGCDVVSSALSMDKFLSKQLWHNADLPAIYGEIYQPSKGYQQYKKLFDNPNLAVKPVAEGSSAGVSKVTTSEQFEPAIALASKFGNVIIEPWIAGIEVTVAILNGKALTPITIKVPVDAPFYDYHHKYVSNDTQYECPSNLPQAQIALLQHTALQAFNAINAQDWGRVDFICAPNGKIWLLEINTVPGLTSHSLVPMAAKHAGLSFDDLILKLATLAYVRSKKFPINSDLIEQKIKVIS